MSVIITKFLCSVILFIMGLVVVRNISKTDKIKLSFKSTLLVIMLIITTIISYSGSYNYVYSIMIYLLTILTYKEILGIPLIRAALACGIMMLSLILLDFITGTFLAIFITVEELRDIWYLNILSNLFFAITLVLVFNTKTIKRIASRFVIKLENKNGIRIILAVFLALITLSLILYTMGKNYSINSTFVADLFLFIVFFILVMILLGERNNYEKLSDEYDSLFSYVQIFEDWIEKEQLIRHEYKNQLAVLRNLTKEKKVKDKIDNIIDDFINIDNQIITLLKSLPNGGLKGLLYYKISIAKKNKLNITVDVDNSSGRVLSKMNEDKLKILTKLLGIYLDNAIEAALETEKKIVTVEIYQLKRDINIVISNSFNVKNQISNRNQKGVSTKGKGRGNGLYFAGNLLSKNNWIEDNQEIIKDLYIQKITIKFKKEKV